MKYSKNHTVYYNKNNEEIPSATTILKLLNKPALVHWGNYLGFRRIKVDEELDRSSQYGTTMHKAIEAFLQKKLFIFVPTNIVRKTDIYRGLNNFFDWYKKHVVEPIFTEKSFSSDLFGGTLDFYGKVDDKYTIIDWKTSKRIRYSMFIQLALYIILLEKHGYQVDRVGIVLIGPNVEQRFMSRKEMDKYIDIAEILVKLFHKYYNTNEEDWKEDII